MVPDTPKWFAGKAGHPACHMAVHAAGPGGFLVRESSSSDNLVLVVNDHGEVYATASVGVVLSLLCAIQAS